MTIKETGIVNAIGVAFPEVEEWSSLERNYNSLKSMLIEKYGEPMRVIEEFQRDYVPDNSSKWHELSMDRCTWFSVFETDKGDIELFIQKVKYGKAAVILKYYDKVNTDVVRASAMDDL